jgi:hypothetical protein
MPRTFPVSSLLFGMLTLAAADLAADQAAMEKLRARLNSAEQYGTECCQMLSIPAAAFVPRATESPVFRYFGTGFIYVYADEPMWAPVILPSGAVLDNIDLYFYDDVAENVCATLMAYTGPTLLGSPPAQSPIGTVCSSSTDGYGYRVEEISGTIDNSVWFSGGAQYAVVLESFNGDGHTAVKGVTIWWHREVSPPPGTATFNDVPTSHPQFQFIEALAKSGITAGCGLGNYCPNNPLTRGQMAVFLAKALGLYTPF